MNSAPILRRYGYTSKNYLRQVRLEIMFNLSAKQFYTISLTCLACMPLLFRPFRSPQYIIQQQLISRNFTMATGSKVKLSTTDCGEFHVPGITAESAAKASEVLQENHENHHIFFNKSGFHSTSYSFHRFPPTPMLRSLLAFALSSP